MFTTHEARFKLWDLIKDIKIAMFTTCQSDGRMHSHPMTTLNSELADDEYLWERSNRSVRSGT